MLEKLIEKTNTTNIMNTTQVNQEPEVQFEFREMYVSATPKKDIPEKGWRGGVLEEIYIQRMSTGKVCIFKSSPVPVKSGYMVYPSIEEMEKDFELHRGEKKFKVN